MLQPSLTRATAHLQRVNFDVNDREHVMAFQGLIENGRQHPTLRFNLEAPFLDVRSMMTAKVTRAFLDNFFKNQ